MTKVSRRHSSLKESERVTEQKKTADISSRQVVRMAHADSLPPESATSSLPEASPKAQSPGGDLSQAERRSCPPRLRTSAQAAASAPLPTALGQGRGGASLVEVESTRRFREARAQQVRDQLREPQVADALVLFLQPKAPELPHRPGSKLKVLGLGKKRRLSPPFQETSEATGTHSPSPVSKLREHGLYRWVSLCIAIYLPLC